MNLCNMILGALVLWVAGCSQGVPRPAVPSPPPGEGLRPSTPPLISQAEAPAEADIWLRLRQADTHYYVLMRHSPAPGTGDPANFQLDDCATQRNLSEAGRDQARRTGEAFQEQGVSVQRVLSSEWCRCLDTATLMDLGPVERFSPLNSFFRDRSKGPERVRQLQEFMVENQDERGVTVLVTHFVTISAIAGSGVASGELVVMQINEANQPEVVEQIEPL